jgi:hypothetical protein
MMRRCLQMMCEVGKHDGLATERYTHCNASLATVRCRRTSNYVRYVPAVAWAAEEYVSLVDPGLNRDNSQRQSTNTDYMKYL